MSEAKLNIYQKLAEIRKLCDAFQKNRQGYGYNYTSIDEILAGVTAGMKKHHVSLVPRIGEDVRVEPYSYSETKATKDGKTYSKSTNELLVHGHITFEWVNDDDPNEKIVVPWFITGSQTDSSQAFGSAMTYALRYFMIYYFQIATLDDTDPDSWRSKQREAENRENIEIAKEVGNDTLAKINSYLDSIEDEAKRNEEREAIIKIIKKYNKKCDIMSITDPVAASKLHEEIERHVTGKIGG